MQNFRSFDVQIAIANDCLRSFIFAGHIASVKIKADAWHALSDICFSDGLLSWNMVFGAKSQDTHWRSFNEVIAPPPNSGLLAFSKAMILDAVELNEQEWHAYHLELVTFRNTRLAHLSHLDSLSKIPKIQPAFNAMYLYRDWLLHLAQAHKLAGGTINPTTELSGQVTARLRSQISELFPDNV